MEKSGINARRGCAKRSKSCGGRRKLARLPPRSATRAPEGQRRGRKNYLIVSSLLDILGLLPSFNADLQNRPDEMKGHSLTQAIDRILTQAHPTGSENVCGSHITAPLPMKTN